MSKMRRSCVLPPNEVEAEGGTADLNAHLVQSLLDQAHLRPLTLSLSLTPTLTLSLTLSLTPTPTLTRRTCARSP